MILVSVTKIVSEYDARRVTRRAFFSYLRVSSDTINATKSISKIVSEIGSQIVSEIGTWKLIPKKASREKTMKKNLQCLTITSL